MRLKLLDKEYAEWLKAVAAHPAKADASGGTTPLPYAIDWASFWAEWTTRVEGAAATSAGVGVDELMQPDTQPVRSLVLAMLEAGRRRLDDASAALHALEAEPPGEAHEAARRRLHELLIAPLTPLHQVSVDAIAESLGRLGLGLG